MRDVYGSGVTATQVLREAKFGLVPVRAFPDSLSRYSRPARR
jgi:hypothetical protein